MVEDSNWYCLLQRLDFPRSQPWRAKAKAKCIFSPAPQYGEPSSSIYKANNQDMVKNFIYTLMPECQVTHAEEPSLETK